MAASKPTTLLRQWLQENQTITAPGVFDGLSARLVQRQGFQAVYASGGAIARSFAYPDIGLVTMTEVCAALTQIVEASQLPVIADADTGFGNAINLRRTVQAFEKLGVAALHVEDQTFPKRCGHLKNKTLISLEDMCQKLRIAKESCVDPDFVIIARTDAIAVEGFDKAIERAKAYEQAGADVIFVEAPQTLEHIEAIASAITSPKLINMFYGGKTPLVPTEQLKKLGYNIIIIPSDLQRAAIKAMEKTLKVIHRDGNSAAMADELTTFKERETIVDTESYLKIQ